MGCFIWTYHFDPFERMFAHLHPCMVILGDWWSLGLLPIAAGNYGRTPGFAVIYIRMRCTAPPHSMHQYMHRTLHNITHWNTTLYTRWCTRCITMTCVRLVAFAARVFCCWSLDQGMWWTGTTSWSADPAVMDRGGRPPALVDLGVFGYGEARMA